MGLLLKKCVPAKLRSCAIAAVLLFVAGRMYAVDGFLKPTPEELAMTSVPGNPGAAAVVLFREEIAKDDLHEVLHYERIKILTEEGKKYANVALEFTNVNRYDDISSEQKTVEDIVARTIHADGTIIPFTGKPYLKTDEKVSDLDVYERESGTKLRADVRAQERVFTMPEVEVGSIIEYRYATRWSQDFYEPPYWYIQGDIYVQSAHYEWYPAVRNDGYITWFSILPPGVVVKWNHAPGGWQAGLPESYEVTLHDIAPEHKEPFMPPMDSLTYRVLFNYSSYASMPEFWKTEGKSWFKRADSFAGPDSELSAATHTITAGAATDDEKLRKIYAAVMELENTDYTRAHGRKEDKDSGAGQINHASDVLKLKRGTGREITELFAGMARAEGMKVSLMLVPDRAERMFNREWQSFMQFDDLLAIVKLDGKEVFFDPGARYVPYGHLAWGDTLVGGLRETEKNPEFASTPGDTFEDNKTIRVANVAVDEHGVVTGTVDFSFSGSPALRWRQQSLRGDDDSLRRDLRKTLEEMVPKTLEVNVANIKGLDDIEKPLLVKFDITGSMGIATGKRLVLPVDLFLAQGTAMFPEEKRDMAVYFHYPQTTIDVLRISFPKELTIEAAPAASKFAIKGTAVYSMVPAQAANSVTVRRDYVFNDAIVASGDYLELRKFCSQFQAKDQESIVLKTAAVAKDGMAQSSEVKGD